MRDVPSTRCESATQQIRAVEAVFDRLHSQETAVEARLPVGDRLSAEQLVIPRIVSIAEEFVRASLVEASERLIELDHPFREDIWMQAEERAESTWAGLREHWNRWHGVAMFEAPQDAALGGLVEVRNSVLHGLGSLTRKQTRSPDVEQKTRSKLAQARVSLDGHRLVLTPKSVGDAAATCIGFIEWLDARLRLGGLISVE